MTKLSGCCAERIRCNPVVIVRADRASVSARRSCLLSTPPRRACGNRCRLLRLPACWSRRRRCPKTASWRPERIVTPAATFVLTYVPTSGTTLRKSRSPKGRQQVTAAGGASAVPAGGGSSLLHSGGFGHHACRYYGRRGRCFPWTGTGGRG